jgi:hypothetical protein
LQNHEKNELEDRGRLLNIWDLDHWCLREFHLIQLNRRVSKKIGIWVWETAAEIRLKNIKLSALVADGGVPGTVVN